MSMMQMLLGAGGAPALKVEDVFNMTLWTGTGSSRTVTTGIDLDANEGMVWIKCRTLGESHNMTDTIRGTNSQVFPNAEWGGATNTNQLTAFSSTGFTLDTQHLVNKSGEDYVGWSFREAEKFFDIVTWTGDNTEPRNIPHNLGCVPGLMLIKRVDLSQYWAAYHVAAGATHYMKLNDNMAAYDNAYFWNDTTPTDEQFTVHSSNSVNANGGSYVAYLFANDEAFIKCGSYTGNNSTTGPVVNVGFEPQWLLVKGIDYAGGWAIQDTERGINVNSPPRLEADQIGAEFSTADNNIQLSSTGFQIKGTGGTYNDNGITYGYVAIKKPD